jgi:hypothetical protein
MREMKKLYIAPTILSEEAFEASALACGKTNPPPPGSFHFTSQVWGFTGHLGPGLGGQESESGSAVIWSPVSSPSYAYSGLCINWVTLAT